MRNIICEGEAWVASNEKGLALIFDGNGMPIEGPVGIPYASDPTGGAPTGIVYNETAKFNIPATGEESEFIYVTLNGTVAASGSGNTAITVVNKSLEGTVYTGLTIAKEGDEWNLYTADFANNRIDVYDDHFNYESDYSFVDHNLPSGYAPFNIREIDGQLVVAYAKVSEEGEEEIGPGLGIVDIFSPDGSFVKRLATGGSLNAPWGIEKIPGSTPGMLIGNFGDGKISVFDMDGNFVTYLMSNGEPIVIEGLWGITFPGTNLPPEQRRRLYFASGPDEETHGIYGFLTPQ